MNPCFYVSLLLEQMRNKDALQTQLFTITQSLKNHIYSIFSQKDSLWKTKATVSILYKNLVRYFINCNSYVCLF